MDHFDERENFAIQSAIVINELEQMIEKTKKIEMQLTQQMQVDAQISTTDFYTPLIETQCEQPPKKRMKCSR